MTQGSRLTLAALLLAAAAPAFAARDVMLVLDNSGSMRKNDPQRLAVQSVRQFIQGQPEDTRVGIIVFSTAAELAAPLTRADAGDFEPALRKLDYRGRWTETAAAVERGLYELREEGRANADKAIVLMTDGLIDTGDRAKDAELNAWLRTNLAPQAEHERVRIYGIAFTEAADYQLLQSIATGTGGDYFRVLEARGIGKTLERINKSMNAARGAPPPQHTIAPPTQAPAAESRTPPPTPEAVEPAPVVATPAAPPASRWGLGAIIGIVLALIAIGAGVAIWWRQRGRRATPGAYDAAGPRGVLRDLATPFSEKPVGAKPLVIGRKAGTDPKREYLVLSEGSVGRWHATIERRGLTFYLRDEGSVNGTFLNGERIKGEEALKHNDLIRIHSHNFQFLIPDLEDSDRTVLASQ